MTVTEALSMIQRVGTVENHAGKLKLRFPATAATQLRSAIDTLRYGKAEALNLLSRPEPGGSWEGIPWAEWKAASLNKLFEEQGVTGEPGRITAATVRHGERKAGGTPEAITHRMATGNERT